MSAEFDSETAQRNEGAAFEGDTDVQIGQGSGSGHGSESGGSPIVRTATADRGGPPMDNPSEMHRLIAARERLWTSYRGGDADRCFVWKTTDCGREEGSARE